MGCGRKIGPYDCCSVVQGDCLELMKALPDGAVDACVTDPPYGVGYAEWDTSIPPLEWLACARRVAKVTLFTPGNGSQYRYPPLIGRFVGLDQARSKERRMAGLVTGNPF